MKLIDYETKQRLRREEAAAEMHRIADDIARHNSFGFERDGRHYTVEIPDDVVLSIEIEVKNKKSELEIELKWKAT